MSLPWFRLYAEFASDPVVQSLAFEDQRHYIVLLCLKCGGVIDRNITSAAKNRIILRALGLDDAAAIEAKRRLIEVDLIDQNWQPRTWNDRQFLSDHSSERVRKHRKNKETGNGNETPSDSSGNGPDTDTYTQADKPSPLPPPDGLNVTAWDEYEQHRRAIKVRKLKPKSVEKLQNWLVLQGTPEIQHAIVEQTIRNGWTGLFELKNGGNNHERSKTMSAVEQVERANKTGEYAGDNKPPIDVTPE